MQMQMQERRISGKSRQNVSTTAVIAYVTQYVRLQMVMDHSQPGHPWFEHQMSRHAAAAKVLREELQRYGRRALPFVRRYATMVAEARMDEYGVTGSVRVRVMEKFTKGELPLVTTTREV